MKRFAAVIAVALGLSSQAHAVKYMQLSEAIKAFVTEGKIIKVTKTLSAEQRGRLASDYGWQPKEDEWVYYEGRDADGKATTTVFIVAEAFNTCFHKYAIGINPSGEVVNALVVELSCPRSFKINRKSFLEQFEGKKHNAALTTKLDVDGVSEATLSSEAVSIATRKALSLFNLFGKAEPAAPSSEMKKARAAGASMIQKAIDTGETLAKDGGIAAAVMEPEKK